MLLQASSPTPALLSPMARLREMVESAHSSAIGLVPNTATAGLRDMTCDLSSVTVKMVASDGRQSSTSAAVAIACGGSRNVNLADTSAPTAIVAHSMVSEQGHQYSNDSFDSVSSTPSSNADTPHAVQSQSVATKERVPVTNDGELAHHVMETSTQSVRQAPPNSSSTSAKHHEQQVSVARAEPPHDPQAGIVQVSPPIVAAPVSKPEAAVEKATSLAQATSFTKSAATNAHAHRGLVPAARSAHASSPPIGRDLDSTRLSFSDSTSTSLIHAHIQAAKRRVARENARILNSAPAAAAATHHVFADGSARRSKQPRPPTRHATGLDDQQARVPKAMLDRIKLNMLLYDMKHMATAR
ncbi:hypothetical protein BCR44DRAFT_1462644 [Catenaria anguillulae PL171]|uniref:Uncharacterized protein n=1 Tax=Catenaria anguillulae PL171 TaxID=765915 RepID=A0A1Y2HFE4_9FUNG|nr:hypothetical protein BCR44DRAFT_1462644 [Catenaria anguillulae PL171]